MADLDNEIEQVTEVDAKNLFVPHRLEEESYIQYRERRLVSHYKLHEMVKGKLIWDASLKGTYRKVA